VSTTKDSASIKKVASRWKVDNDNAIQMLSDVVKNESHFILRQEKRKVVSLVLVLYFHVAVRFRRIPQKLHDFYKRSKQAERPNGHASNES
jgi:hypothetical protein